jgi:hypothetical protein
MLVLGTPTFTDPAMGGTPFSSTDAVRFNFALPTDNTEPASRMRTVRTVIARAAPVRGIME